MYRGELYWGTSSNSSKTPLDDLDEYPPLCKIDGKILKPQSRKRRRRRAVPSFKRITGTRILVDAFQYASDEWDTYFLTHFHADHYTCLSSNFSFGTIYCSPITARLVTLRLGVSPDRVVSIPLGEPTNVSGATVTFLDANHCPGAVLILFQVNGRYSLHTGDMRYHPRMEDYASFQGITVDEIYLDTTYCDPKHVFPTQEDTILYVLSSIRDELLCGASNTLFVFGTYTIGKERILYAVARQYQVKIYCKPWKMDVLRTYGLEDFDGIFTDDPAESRFHTVSMSQCSFVELKKIRQQHKGEYDRVVGFRPTGWTGKRGYSKSDGAVTLYSVPYSEHSSFPELQAFVRCFPGSTIIPTVNVRTAKQQVSMLTKQKSITSFFASKKTERSALCTLNDASSKTSPITSSKTSSKTSPHVKSDGVIVSSSSSMDKQSAPAPLKSTLARYGFVRHTCSSSSSSRVALRKRPKSGPGCDSTNAIFIDSPLPTLHDDGNVKREWDVLDSDDNDDTEEDDRCAIENGCESTTTKTFLIDLTKEDDDGDE